jgi:glutamate-1-semialdehyde aminotransferase
MVLGKALGNGYAITAVLGQRNVMETAQSSFISSTFWTERIGPTAALASLAKLDSLGSWEILPRFGRLIKQGWESLANQYDLPILVQGIDAIPSFVIQSEAWLPYKTLITQQCLKSGILAGNLFYPSTAHKEEDFHHYFDVLDGIFSLIAECEAGRDVMALLDGEVCHSGFKRLN